MNDDKAFISQYAAEIARALREQEDGSGPLQSVEDSTWALYRALCFDEPRLDDIPNLASVASALCRHLTNSSSEYALSNRLVNGITYLCRQRSTTTKANGASGVTSNNENPAMEVILAKLAFCVLIQVPLECCQGLLSKDVSTLQHFLGSYQGSVEVEDIRLETIEETNSETDQKVTQLTNGLSGSDADEGLGDMACGSPSQEQQETSSFQEVWAADSDPSDYAYEDGDADGLTVFPQAIDFVDLLDPIILSRPDPDRSLNDACGAIGSLLQQANYSIMAPIFQLAKKQFETYAAQLTQLLLLILQPPRSILSPDEDSSSSMQDVLLTPLWILRDVALHHPSHDESLYTNVYLEAVQTLLAVDQAYQSDTQQSNPLCSASIVGLSALSSWCCSAQISVSATTSAILDAMNDLTHVIERAAESGYREHLQHSISPVLEILTGITFENRKIGGATGGGAMVPKTLLNSGLLRQLLVLSLDNRSDDEGPPYYLDHALWGLCVTYPAVVGKYVARYPGFSSIVRRYSPAKPSARDCVQSILWNSFAFSHDMDGSVPQIVWKSKGVNGVASPSPLTKDECQEVSQKSWTQLCRLVQESLVDPNPLTSTKQSLDIVQDWERLLKFVGVPSIAPTFQTLIADYDIQLSAIRNGLATATVGTNASDIRNTNEKLDGEEEDRKKSSMTHQELIVATTRKALKQYTLFFQGSARSSSKTD